jgi:hypothetical protein
VSGIVLSPWPDLLSDEARRMGQFRWCMELLKSLIPLVAAVGVGLKVGLAFQRRHASKPRGPISE